MKITLEMPQVAKCFVTQCAYNAGASCHAKAITVGDNARPACDTFFSTLSHSQSLAILAGVGACKVAECRYNEDFECTAEKIEVGFKGKAADCLTFAGRQ